MEDVRLTSGLLPLLTSCSGRDPLTSMPFIGIESRCDKPVPCGDGQVRLANPECDLLTIEFSELKNEMFGNGGPVQGESVEVYRRICTVRPLTED